MDENNTTYDVEVIDDTNKETVEVKKKNAGKKVLIGGVILGAVGTAILYKTKKKREQLAVKRLEKKGYTVIKPEHEVDSDYEESDEEE